MREICLNHMIRITRKVTQGRRTKELSFMMTKGMREGSLRGREIPGIIETEREGTTERIEITEKIVSIATGRIGITEIVK